VQARGVVLLHYEAVTGLCLNLWGRLRRRFKPPLPFVFFESHCRFILTNDHRGESMLRCREDTPKGLLRKAEFQAHLLPLGSRGSKVARQPGCSPSFYGWQRAYPKVAVLSSSKLAEIA
jgi:hypothetical protein